MFATPISFSIGGSISAFVIISAIVIINGTNLKRRRVLMMAMTGIIITAPSVFPILAIGMPSHYAPRPRSLVSSQDLKRLKFEPAKKILQAAGLPFNPDIFVFPIVDHYPMGTTLDQFFASRGENSPQAGERTFGRFALPRAQRGSITVNVDGIDPEVGRKNWNLVNHVTPGPDASCAPQVAVCDGANPYVASTGDPGTGSGYVPTPNNSFLDGNCNGTSASSTMNDGLPGVPGTDGNTGPDNAGQGQTGPKGDGGGTVQFTVTNTNLVYVFSSRGGQGNQGGKGGEGAPGDRAQDGARGAKGADCPCDRGGSGDGTNGMPGGRGGKGGPGGRGGTGGPGGDGGAIFVDYPATFPSSRMTAFVNGGPPGIAGEGGVGGVPGIPGEGGVPGFSTGNAFCPATPLGATGTGGDTLPNFGHGDRGPVGSNSTVTGALGNVSYTPINPGVGSGGGSMSNYIPNGWNSYGACTEWYWVEFHCTP